ncbi:MAG: hypothetical protein AB7T63_10010 [Planctomycetota bacterium]
MTRGHHPDDPALTPDEARLLDGSLPAEERRRLDRQLAADPARAGRLARDRAALDLWVEEARSTPVDVDALAQHVFERIDDENGVARFSSRAGLRGEVLSPRAAMAYAAAAMLLIGVGLAGTWVVRQQRAEAVPSAAPAPEIADPDAPLLDGVRNAVQRGIMRKPGSDADAPGAEK